MNKGVLISLLLVGFVGATARSATYYVEAARGNDAWAGTVANGGFLPSGCESDGNTSDCANGPWKTLAKVNAAPLNPGDSVLLKRGEVWREPLVVGRSGNASSPITFGAYGSGNLPKIIASAAVTGWTLSSGHTYVANFSGTVNHVLVDGVYLEEAQEPDNDFFTIDADAPTAGPNDNKVIIDNDLTLAPSDVIGAIAKIKTVNWDIETRTVTAYDLPTHTLTLDSPAHYDIKANFGYQLKGKTAFLDRAGEWAYDSATSRLYVWLWDGTHPASHQMEIGGSTVAVRFVDGNRNYITLKELAIEGASSDGILAPHTIGTRIQGIQVSFCRTGINVGGSQDLVVENSTIRKCAEYGLYVGGVAGGRIAGNTVEDTGQSLTDAHQTGVNAFKFDNAFITGNTVVRSGYIGIDAVGDHLTVDSNRVEDSCLSLNDCAAIYTGIGTSGVVLPNGMRIANNFIRRSVGFSDGSPTSYSQAEGIYLDDFSEDVTVENNAIMDVGAHGVFLHNAHDNKVLNNIVFGAKRGALAFQEDSLVIRDGKGSAGYATNNRLEGNTFVNDIDCPSRPVSIVGYLGSSNVGTFDRNTYGQLHADELSSISISGSPVTYYNLAKWRSERNQDLNSTWIGDWYKTQRYRTTAVLGANLISNGTFDASLAGWGRYPGEATIAWDASEGAAQPGSLRLTYGGAASAFTTSPTFPLAAGSMYELKYKARVLSDTSLTPIIRLNAPPWTIYARDRIVATPEWKTHTFHFSSTVTVPNARFDFESPEGVATTYWLDDVQLVPVTAVLNDPQKALNVLVNDTGLPQIHPLSGRAADPSGKVLEGAVMVPPLKIGALLFPYDNADGACNNRETHATAPGDCAVGEQGPDVDDRVPPGPPSSLKATVHSSTQISLVWGAAVDDRIVRGYRVSRNGALLGEAAGLSFADSGLTPGKVYFYSVAAVDEGNNLSEPATLVAATWPTDADPAVLKSTRKVVTPGAGASTDGAVFGANARRLEVFTARGDKVFESSSDGAAPLHWEGQDGGGAPVVSGAYLVVVTDAQGRQEFQVIAVEH